MCISRGLAKKELTKSEMHLSLGLFLSRSFSPSFLFSISSLFLFFSLFYLYSLSLYLFFSLSLCNKALCVWDVIQQSSTYVLYSIWPWLCCHMDIRKLEWPRHIDHTIFVRIFVEVNMFRGDNICRRKFPMLLRNLH